MLKEHTLGPMQWPRDLAAPSEGTPPIPQIWSRVRNASRARHFYSLAAELQPTGVTHYIYAALTLESDLQLSGDSFPLVPVPSHMYFSCKTSPSCPSQGPNLVQMRRGHSVLLHGCKQRNHQACALLSALWRSTRQRVGLPHSAERPRFTHTLLRHY